MFRRSDTCNKWKDRDTSVFENRRNSKHWKIFSWLNLLQLLFHQFAVRFFPRHFIEHWTNSSSFWTFWLRCSRFNKMTKKKKNHTAVIQRKFRFSRPTLVVRVVRKNFFTFSHANWIFMIFDDKSILALPVAANSVKIAVKKKELANGEAALRNEAK